MTRAERRLAIRIGVLGLLLTLTVMAADFAGAFANLERWLYDGRARHCQFFLRTPTTQLVHVDIDDRSLDTIDQFPWPRSTMAELVDEIGRAGAKVLAFDVIFDKPQKTEYVAERNE